jgi:two-component system sensor kinase FixL
MSRQSNSRVASPLTESSVADSRDRGLIGRRFPRASNAIFLLAASALIYQVAAAVLTGSAPAWILLAVIVLSVACLLLVDGLQTRRLELRRAARELALVADAGALGTWHWDIAADRLFADGRTRELLSLKGGPEGIESDSVFARVHPDDVDDARRAFDDAGPRGYAHEFRIVLDSGGYRWIGARGEMLYDEHRAPVGLQGVFWDATERRTAGDRFRTLLDAAPIAILLVDPRGRIALANGTANALFGYAGDALVRTPMDALVPRHHDDAHAAPELFAIRRDGTQLPAEVALRPVHLDGEVFVLAVVSDLTERRARDAESVRQRDELAHLSRVKVLGELCGALAHELNQPIAAIMSNAQAAVRMLSSTPPAAADARAALVDIVESDRRAGDVIRRLRSWLRKDHEEFAPLDINEVVVTSLRLLRTTLINRGVEVHTTLGTRLPMVYGDRIQLQQVLVNLVMNGCDAMEGLPVRRLEVHTEAASGRVRVRVVDEGTGIASAVRDRLFEPFETTKPQGMGMGLAVCRTIVDAHDGVLDANNNPTSGATFRFDLPGMLE